MDTVALPPKTIGVSKNATTATAQSYPLSQAAHISHLIIKGYQSIETYRRPGQIGDGSKGLARVSGGGLRPSAAIGIITGGAVGRAVGRAQFSRLP